MGDEAQKPGPAHSFAVSDPGPHQFTGLHSVPRIPPSRQLGHPTNDFSRWARRKPPSGGGGIHLCPLSAVSGSLRGVFHTQPP